MKRKNPLILRTLLMLSGIAVIGCSVGFYRLSELGVDACTGMNLGISSFLHMSFGNWQLIANILILTAVFFTMRSCIGIGTIVNMICVGYIADFICWLFNNIVPFQMGTGLRLLFMSAALLLGPAGVALYMKANMGIAPYDSIAPVIEKLTKGKLSFTKARIFSDIVCLSLGCIFCLLSGGNIWHILNIATVINALITGPLIRFARGYLDRAVGDLSV